MFDWQTEEDGAWEELPAQREQQKRRWRTPNWWWLALPLLAAVASLTVYRQAQRQTEKALETVEQDVVSSQRLLFDAIAARDQDLLRVLLSGRDMGWVYAVERLVQENEFVRFTPLSLEPVPNSYEIGDVVFSPQLDVAEVLYRQEFTITPLLAEPQTVTLEQSATFRLGETRWLYAPPQDDYWGEWRTQRLDEVTLVFPERDADFVDELARELEAWLPQFCETLPDFPCDSWRKTIRFEPSLQSRLLLSETPAALYANQTQLELPAPSLLGTAVNNADRTLLIDAYKSLIGRVYIADVLSYRCCDQVLIFDALSAYQLTQLGLYEWPIEVADHHRAWQTDSATLDGLPLYWQTETILPAKTSRQEELLLLVDFLVQTNPSASVVTMQRMLNQSAILTSSQWLNQLFIGDGQAFFRGDRFTHQSVLELWRSYAELYFDAETAFGDEAPTQALLLTCLPMSGNAIDTAVYQYTAETSRWALIAAQEGYGLLFPFGNDSRILFETLPVSADSLSNVLEVWTMDGGRQTVPQLENAYNLSLGQISDDGRFLTGYNFDVNPNDTGPQTQLFDLDACTPDGCRQVNLPGTPYWSPDGHHALVQEFSDFDFLGRLGDGRVFLVPSPTNYPLHIVDAAAIAQLTRFVEVGEGYSPFWLDNNRFGFVRHHDTSDVTELHLATVDQPQSEVLLTTAALQNATPATIGSTTWHIAYAQPLGNRPNSVIVVANDRSNVGHLFFFNLETRGVRYGTRLDDTYSHHLAVSPDGGYLAASQLTDPANPAERNLLLLDLETGGERLFPLAQSFAFPALMFDWSLDGEWLAVKSELNALQVIHLPSETRTVLPHPNQQCSALMWIRPFP